MIRVLTLILLEGRIDDRPPLGNPFLRRANDHLELRSKGKSGKWVRR